MKQNKLLILATLVCFSLCASTAKAMIPEEAHSSTLKWKFPNGCKIKSQGNSKLFIKEGNESLEYDETNKPAFKNDTGEVVVEYSGVATDGNKGRSWAKATFQPKGYSAAHHHKERTEDYYITAAESGKARVIINGKNHDLSVGDYIQVKPHDIHQVINLSEIEPVELVVKCFPSWIFADVHFEKQ